MSVFAVHHLLERSAESVPDRIAVRCDGAELSYAELERRSSGIAATLVDAGVEPGDRVGLYVPKSVDTVAAIYGIMKAGAAYVPIDPSSPVLRAATIAGDCTVAAMVTTPDRLPQLAEGLGDHRPRCALLVGDVGSADGGSIPSIGLADAADAGGPDPRVPVVDTDLAYILYTSGSTGTPKGVMLTHRHAITFVEWCASTIGTQPDDRFSNHAPFHFDLSVFDLYVAAYGGASVSIVPERRAYFGRDLASFLREESITVWYSVPSALMLIARAVDEGESFPSLRAVVFAGEVYPTKHLRALMSVVPAAELWNLYGPTETNVCTAYRVTELEDDAPIPIGRAIENTEVVAVTDDGRAAGVDEEGELYVRGSTVMKGYWGNPERSAEVLVPHPLRSDVVDPVYRTGDLVRLRPDGDYDFLGRRDHQIKSRGYRIELGEVEAALHADPRVDVAVAIAVPHEDWGTAIVAYVVPKQADEVPTEIDVKRHAAQRLPRYMVPARVEIRDELPRTSTGKVDRRTVADEATARAWSWS
ncbi:MAG TPA: amino acid adenylation domain-containing protein [Actinomycetota bacterium]